MTKDYAKRKRPKRKNNTRTPKNTASKKPMSPILVFIGGILITLVVVFLWAVIKKPDVLKELVTTEEISTKKTTEAGTSEQSNSSQQQNTKPKVSDSNDGTEFTYHETLTNKKVDVEVTKPEVTNSNKSYIMQCGAFKQLADAERMKAELAFIGFQATILSKGEWHRVRLGPYQSKRNAESDRHKLQNNNYQTCQIW